MPPKKAITSPITEKKPLEKVVKKRARAVKPKLKIPTVVKIKIPAAQTIAHKRPPKLSRKPLPPQEKLDLANDAPKPPPKLSRKPPPPQVKLDLANEAPKRPPKLSRKPLPPQEKLDLANEVARAQLVKPEPVLLCEEPDVKTVRGGRKKKVVSKFFNESNTPAATETPKQKIKLNRKKATEDLENKIEKTIKKPIATAKKRVTNSTDKPKPAKKPRVTKSKTGIINNSGILKNEKDNTCEQPNKTLRKSRPRLVKGKVNKADDVSTENSQCSPSILQTKVFQNASPTKIKDKNKTNVPINSRKSSATSNSSISWTKDISGSSTTTCLTVTSNDFVRFNKKIPVISLTNVDRDLKRKASKVAESSSSSSSSSSDSDSSSSVSEQTGMEMNGSLLDMNSQHLNLSTSSLSVRNHNDSSRNVARNKVCQIGAALDLLSTQLKQFDLEIVEWIGYDTESNNDDVKKFHDKITKVFKEENDVIMHCRKIKKVLADDTDKDAVEIVADDVSPIKSQKVNLDTTNAVNLDISYDDFDGDTHFDSDDNANMIESYNENITPPVNVQKELSSEREDFTSDKVRYAPFDYNNDDDDALSLFAESITGIESSKMNSSMPSTSSVQHEEYIPEPIMKEWTPSDKLTYCPSKIKNSTNEQLTMNSKNKSICEKQNADSTSIKEFEGCKSVDDNVFIVPNQHISVNKDSVRNPSENPLIWNSNSPCLMASRYKLRLGQKSVLFKDICFFNMISSCKNPRCRYPHVELSLIEIKNRLTKLSEVLFIEEYMLMRNWSSLRRKYGFCFVEECDRRDLTRILVEMSIDSIKPNSASREDTLLATEVIEYTLLHLNKVNLNDYKDFLLYKIHKGSLLCDVYLQVISDTQNFSRFKLVFLNLIQFIIDNKGTFRLSVSEHILERVCILPYEEPLIRAVVGMIRYTDSSILQNSMMRLFEKQLANVGVKFYEEFMEFKKQASLTQQVVVNPFIESPIHPNEVEPVPVVNNTQKDRGERYTSPDTTNLDNLNKLTDEPIITRTIHMNPSRNMGFQQSFTPKMTKDFRPKNKFSHWNNKSIMLKMFNGFSSQMNSPVNKPLSPPPAVLQANQRQVIYKTSPSVCTV